MINVATRRLFICTLPVDMRKGMDGLAGVVLSQLQREPTSGEIFIFIGRRARVLKALCWDGAGYGLCSPGLAEGWSPPPHNQRRDGRATAVELSETEWHLLLDGIVVRDRVLLKRHRRSLAEDQVRVPALMEDTPHPFANLASARKFSRARWAHP